jgi:hypothetical protein
MAEDQSAVSVPTNAKRDVMARHSNGNGLNTGRFRKERCRGKVRERFGHDLRTDPDWALREAGHIANHVRLRSDYEKYRGRFFKAAHHAVGNRHEAAWEREHALRRLEACHRRETRLLLRAVARVGTRGLTRQVAYWTIDALMTRRRVLE